MYVHVLCNRGTRGTKLCMETRYCDAALRSVPRFWTFFYQVYNFWQYTSKLYAVIIVIVCLFIPWCHAPLRLCHASSGRIQDIMPPNIMLWTEYPQQNANVYKLPLFDTVFAVWTHSVRSLLIMKHVRESWKRRPGCWEMPHVSKSTRKTIKTV